MTFNKESRTHKTDAYLALLERHKGILYKVARSYATGMEIDDLVQDICLQLWGSFERYDDRFAESTWVYRIALNTCISAYRKEKRRETSATDVMHILHPAVDRHQERLDELYKMIQTLKEIDRALLLLYLEGKDHKEIALIMGYTETNVSTRLSRIRNELKSMTNTLNK